MNNWRIPADLEKIIRKRDERCIYCSVAFDQSDSKLRSSWEHINNDENLINADNIALCCTSCNASKGSRMLDAWLASDYCKSKGIRCETIATVARNYLTIIGYKSEPKS